jgi:hypothetical protein
MQKGDNTMTEKNTNTMVPAENKNEAEEVMAFLNELSGQEKNSFLTFIQGIRFARGMTQGDRRTA